MGEPDQLVDTAVSPSQPPLSAGRVHPTGVPHAAVWVDAEDEWQLRLTDDAGLLNGPFRSWRADGSLRTVASYRLGKQVGATWRFHPDGSLFYIGNFVDGSPHGVHRRYANPDPRAERLQSCCVPAGAWQLQQTYARGQSIDRGWFNHDGARLLDSGEPYPERPASVPPRAVYNETGRVWETGTVSEDGGPTGTRKRWSADGVLGLVEDLTRGKRHGVVQAFGDDGSLAWQGHFVDGHLSGAFVLLGLPAGHFADPAIRQEEGAFTDDQAQGVWRYRDATGAVRQERDLGLVLDEESLRRSSALANGTRPAAAWRTLAGALFAARRVGEALLCAARAAAAAGDAAFLKESLDAWTMPLGSDVGRAQARDVVDRAQDRAQDDAKHRLVPLVDALKRGGDAAILLNGIAKVLEGFDRAGLDLVTAALLLAPDWTQPLTTRALLYASLGDVASASADVDHLGADSPEQQAFLDLYLRVSFPRFDFWPLRETLPPLAGEGLPRPERTLSEVRDVIQRYATRLGRLRQALAARVPPEASFMIPDLGALLPEGPLALSRWTFSMSIEEYEGGEPVEGDPVEGDEEGMTADGLAETSNEIAGGADDQPRSIEIVVDEGHDLVWDDSTVPQLLRQARADWSGLTWLCWAVGLEVPALPDAIRPPAVFSRAAVTMLERAWRCHDKMNTSGLLAMTKGIPGFEWEGTAIDLVPATLVPLALGEYIEARAVFSWLCDPMNRSPWQEDLRAPG